MSPAASILVEALGWAATAVFVASYLFRRAELLVRVQMAGAVMWVCYGALKGAAPVVVANVLVLAAAAWKARQASRAPGVGHAPGGYQPVQTGAVQAATSGPPVIPDAVVTRG